MENEQAVNNIAKKLGNLLISSGMNFLQSAFHLEPIKISGGEVNTILRKYFPTEPISHLDGYYYLIPISQFKEIIEYDWVSTKEWIAEKRDCDNFANAFSANMSMYYEINSVGRVYGKFYSGTQKFVDYHYFNVIIDSNKNIWFFEPKTDKLTEVKYEGGMILINGNKYEVIHFLFG